MSLFPVSLIEFTDVTKQLLMWIIGSLENLGYFLQILAISFIIWESFQIFRDRFWIVHFRRILYGSSIWVIGYLFQIVELSFLGFK